MLANILPGLGIDEFLTRTDVVAGVSSSFLTDALGSPVGVTDNACVLQTEYTYEPFGKTTFTGSSNSNPYQYTGRENDGTGLFHYRARYYHPQLQRFISEDPIEFEGGDINRYAYVGNDPMNFVDPYGLFSFGRALDGLSSLGGALGPLFDIGGNALDASGDGGYYGGAAGAAAGAVACSAFGPLAAAGCGVGGGLLGGALGGLLDPPCAGQLNCGEPPPYGGRKDKPKPKGRGASAGWGGGASGNW
ncbi:MAG: RHS repeat-associated core domain-containing protein [Candidatus Binatia bacterium]